MTQNRILILDFGSQFTQLIARRIRELRVYCEIHPPTVDLDFVRSWDPKGIILSGGPNSVYGDAVPTAEAELLELGVPVLGICYGMQLIAQLCGGRVIPGRREYGRAEIRVTEPDELFHGFATDEPVTVWASHGDHVDVPPPSFRTVAATGDLPVAAFRAVDRPIFGVQFHPEVAHTPRGEQMLSNFVFRVCGCEPTWTAGSFINEAVERIRAQVGRGKVICGLSGGVDSSVAAALVLRAIGEQLTCIFVDNGVLRKGERETVESAFRRHLGSHLIVVDARQRFLERLAGVTDPEEKRRRIGEVFIRVSSNAWQE